MKKTGYGVYFDKIVTGDTVPNGKPAPDIFLSAAEKLGVAPEHCLVLEDSPNGVRAGLAAGMYVIMVPDLEEPDADMLEKLWHCCRTLQEVPALVEAENQTNAKGDAV
jgi:beta-phosphoglucomutase-like phosphatase (HAD superfamily)